MRLNGDLSVRTRVHGGKLEWVPSPAKGVDRRMLFRIGDEKARATSIVRYAPGSSFARHGHPGGEEFLVLEGIFQDETGDFPVGTYVRNPPGTAHAPASAPGCTILVKLWQFAEDDNGAQVVRRPGEGEAAAPRPGAISSAILHDDGRELVLVELWDAEGLIAIDVEQGLELLVLEGDLREGGEPLDRWSWLRIPAGQRFEAKVGSAGARVWLKFGPLLHDNVCTFDNL